MVLKVSLNTGINRIRLEFKDIANTYANAVCFVLIESDWNLKACLQFYSEENGSVLIESDWNLKFAVDHFSGYFFNSINRIRLEFKDSCISEMFPVLSRY